MRESKTTRIKVIDNFYPLIGNVIVDPVDSFEILKSKPNTILVDKTTKNNLDLKIGEKLKYKKLHLKLLGVIESLPDIGSFCFW